MGRMRRRRQRRLLVGLSGTLHVTDTVEAVSSSDVSNSVVVQPEPTS